MRRTSAIAFIAAALIAASCGSDSASLSSRRGSNGPITTTIPPPLDGTVADVAHEFWHSGFRVRLDAAEVSTTRTVLTNRVSYWLTLRGEFTNEGGEIATFAPTMAVEADRVSYSQRSGDPPRLRPYSSARGELTFLIPEDLDLRSAVLVVGAEEETRALVPIGDVGTFVGLAPTEIAVDATATSDFVDVALSGVSLRYDIPELYRQLELGRQAMAIRFDVTSSGPGTARISADDLTLVLADGTDLEPVTAELMPIPGSEEGITTTGLEATFVVPDSLPGDIALRLHLPPSLTPEDGGSELILVFSL